MRRRRQSLPRQPARCAEAPRTATMTWRRLIRPSASPGPARKASRCVSGTITLNQHANPAGTGSSIPEPPIAAPRHPRAPSRDPPRAPSPGCGCSSCPPTPLVSTRWKGSGRCSSATCWPTPPSPASATWSTSSGTAEEDPVPARPHRGVPRQNRAVPGRTDSMDITNYRSLLREVMCRAASFKVPGTQLSVHGIGC